MSDWSPQDIDDLFQQTSQEHHFEYKEEAWKDLEQMLDKKERDRSFIWWFFGIFGLLVFTGIGYLLMSSNTSVSTDKKTNSSSQTTVSNNTNDSISIKGNLMGDTKISSSYKKEQQQQTEYTNTPTKSVEQKSTNLSTINNTNRHYNLNNSDTVTNNEKNTSQETRLGKEIVTKVVEQKNTLNKLNNTPTLSTNRRITSIENGTKKETITNTTEQKDPNNFTLPNQSIVKRKYQQEVIPMLPPVLTKAIIAPIDLAKKEVVPNQASIFQKKKDNFFAIGLLTGLESSTVKETALCIPKWKVGIHVDYNFAKRFNTSIGINYVQKEYVAKGSSYQPPKGFWSRSRSSGAIVIPETAKANCDILEIPLSFSYFPKGYRTKGIYFSAGISSFIMLKEDYQYRYATEDSSLRAGWVERNENQHFFSEAELALGYQIPFANHTSLLFGPYLQVPLSGIGHGNIEVLSIGLTAKYRFHVE